MNVGDRFGRWTVLCFKRGKQSRALCKCDCGTEREIYASSLRRTLKPSKSCGCLTAETARARLLTHGLSRSPAARSWYSMLERTSDPSHVAWKYYGGRGIRVCERWKKFENFLADMGNRPTGSTLDRVDTNGNYEPQNCRWATRSEQQRNKRPFSRKAAHG